MVVPMLMLTYTYEVPLLSFAYLVASYLQISCSFVAEEQGKTLSVRSFCHDIVK